LLENVNEVRLLLTMHMVLGGQGPGRRRNIEVLNKSAIVLVVACWEAFVEDTATAALEFMIDRAASHTALPTSVLDRVGSKYSGLNAWRLAGDGWKTALKANLSEVLAKTTGALNTPRAQQVDELFLKSIGLPSLSSHWYWKGRSQSSAVAALDRLIALRGSIAHRVQHSESVRKREVVDALELTSYLAAKTTNAVRTHVHKRVLDYPWDRMSYNGIG
jgi:hypothetical protein